MNSYRLAMILVRAQRAFMNFLFSFGLANIVLVNIWIPFVWQWFSLRAKRSFIHFLISYGLVNIVLVNVWVPCVRQNDDLSYDFRKVQLWITLIWKQIIMENFDLSCVFRKVQKVQWWRTLSWVMFFFDFIVPES